MEFRYQDLFESVPISIWEEDWTGAKEIVDRLAVEGVTNLPAYFMSHPECIGEIVDRIKVLDDNEATLEIFGGTDKSVFFEKIAEATMPDFYSTYVPRITSFAIGTTRLVTETPRRRLDGTTFDARVTVELSSQHLVNWSHVYVVVEDITEGKRSEQFLRQSQALAAIGRLTGGIAHDFNNLLAVIMGYAQILESRTDGEGKELAGILDAATRGSQLIQRLLSFARQQSLTPQVIDLAELLVDMEDMLRRTLPGAIEIEFRYGPGSRLVLADRGQLENAVLNLALNARDAMPKGGRLCFEIAEGEVSADERPLSSDLAVGRYWTLTVQDNGTGIPEDVLEQVFEPFFTTKSQSQHGSTGNGNGLGLSMVYGFVKQSNGHVTVDSWPGGGTIVKLYLPEAKKEPQSAEQTARQTGDPARGQGETVAVIEDDPELRRLVVSFLEDLGYQVMQARDGPSADALLSSNRQIDLLLTEVLLRGTVNGIELAADWRRRKPDLAVLLLSGFVDDSQDQILEDMDLLQKPFTPRDLA